MENVPNSPLAFVTHRLFLHLYKYPENQEPETYTPDSYLKFLQMNNPIFETDKCINPNELLIYILDTLHDELNNPRNNNIISPKNNYDKTEVLQCGIMTFQNRYNSIVSNLLNWFELKEISCETCNNSTYSFHTYNTLDLDILGCSNNNNNNPININNCLLYKFLTKQKEAYCSICRKNTQMYFSSKIYFSSYEFIFLLNRGNMDPNLMNIKFFIEEKINLRNFIENQNAPSLYQLKGIVSIDLKNSKYVSFCMSPVDNNWYCYNDENIELLNLKQILQFHNNNNIFIPCILIYETIN